MNLSQLSLNRPIRKIVLLFHGLCRNGPMTLEHFQSWQNISNDLLIIAPDGPYVCGIIPNAYQWFSFDLNYLQLDFAKLHDSTPRIIDFINKLLTKFHLTYSDLFLAGYSQGAIYALYLTYYVLPNLAGTIAYSGSLPMFSGVPIHSAKTPTLLIHGTYDHLVPYQESVRAEQLINSIGGNAQLILESGNGHTVSKRGLAWGKDFIEGGLSTN